MKIDNAKEAGCELDEMEAHRFLEKVREWEFERKERERKERKEEEEISF